MDVYKIDRDSKNCQSVETDRSTETPKSSEFKEGAISNGTAQKFYIRDPRMPRSNFYSFGRNLVFDQLAYCVLQSIFEKAGEIRPMNVEGVDNLYILNPLARIDALDKHNSEPFVSRTGEKYGVKRYAFHTSAFSDSSLFWLTTHASGPAFSYIGKLDPEEEFIGRYRLHNLTGLRFEHMWSGDQ